MRNMWRPLTVIAATLTLVLLGVVAGCQSEQTWDSYLDPASVSQWKSSPSEGLSEAETPAAAGQPGQIRAADGNTSGLITFDSRYADAEGESIADGRWFEAERPSAVTPGRPGSLRIRTDLRGRGGGVNPFGGASASPTPPPPAGAPAEMPPEYIRAQHQVAATDPAAVPTHKDARPTELSAIARPADELWVIVKHDPNDDFRPATRANFSSNDPLARVSAGALAAEQKTADGATEFVPVPLEHTDVEGSVLGFVASVNVRQRFHNPYDSKIEAVYVFPLPEDAAVSDFLMTVGDRTIRGVVREREEAERIYDAARSRGHVASLMTQERPNVFTQKVANIEPGKRIDIDITYFNTLSYVDGWFELSFPMVVGPRFNPGESRSIPAETWPGGAEDSYAEGRRSIAGVPDPVPAPSTLLPAPKTPTPPLGSGIGAVARGSHGASGQATEIQYLAPDERSGHDIALTFAIDPGVSIEEIESPTHRIAVTPGEGYATRVQLASETTIPNKDFILRWRVAGDQPKAGLTLQRDEDGTGGGGGYFAMMLIPPAEAESLERAPVEFIFVVDTSGSMSGEPIEQAKKAMLRALDSMRPGDAFQIVEFNNTASSFGPRTVPATPENIREAKRYVQRMRAGGGTMAVEGVRKAASFPADPERPTRARFVTFMTDGFIGNETEIFREIDRTLGDARVFSFGVGSSPNRYLIDGMARIGRGAVAYLNPGDDGDRVMDFFFERVARPALTDIAIDWGSMNVGETYPSRVPDLYVGRPVVLVGRYEGSLDDTTVRVRGRAMTGEGPATVETRITVVPDEARTDGALKPVWARMKIADLARREALAQSPSDRGEFADMIRSTALAHGIMSAYTAFIAVDSAAVTSGTSGATVAVPVPVPDGVRYETTVTPGS